MDIDWIPEEIVRKQLEVVQGEISRDKQLLMDVEEIFDKFAVEDVVDTLVKYKLKNPTSAPFKKHL